MAVAAVNVDDDSERPGRLRSFLRRFMALFSRLLFLKKKPKAKSRSRNVDASSSDEFELEFEEVAAWTPERLNIVEKLWGEGCISPSSAEFLQITAPMLSLDEKKSLLLLGAGLGGLGRALVDGTGVWVTGLEGDEELAGIGKEMTKMAGMQKRAPVALSNLEQAKLK